MLDLGRDKLHGPYPKRTYSGCFQGTEEDTEFQEVKFG